MLGIDLRDSRLKGVSEPLEKGNFKKALLEVNKILKKSPSCTTAKALKSMVLLKSGKLGEAALAMEEILGACPTDEPTLSIVLSYFRETGQSSREAEYLTNALKKSSNREDLLVCLFLNQVQTGNFAAQQSTARLLSQQSSSRMYVYWVIVSTLMQAETDPELGKRMFLPLAEKMLIREVTSNKMVKHLEFQLLIDVLRRLEKYKDALDFLNSKSLTDRLDELDYIYDYSNERLSLLASLDLWEDALTLGKEKVNNNPDDWNTWRCLIEFLVKCDSDENRLSRLQLLDDLVCKMITGHPNSRGPQLAQLDMFANANSHEWNMFSSSQISMCLRTYLNRFSSKPVCPLDVAYLIPLLLPVVGERTQFLSSVLHDVQSQEVKIPPNANQTYEHLCAYQIARANSHFISLSELLAAYFTFAPERKSSPLLTPKKLGTERANDSAVDLCPADGFLLLAVSSLVEQTFSLSDSSAHVHAFGLALLAAYWIEYLGLVHASNNHHFRLRLCTLFTPHILACPDLSLVQLERLEAKQLLLVSLGHFFVSAAPVLTLWSDTTSTTTANSQPDSLMLASYKRLHMLAGSIVSEAQEGILAAYRRCVYTKVQEFTRFSERLRHADVFLTARIELLHWQVVIIPDDFDSALEHIGPMLQELELVSNRLEHIADCRDLSLSLTFDPPIDNKQTQKDTFTHLVQWIRLRLISLWIVRNCAELVMDGVRMENKQIGLLMGNIETQPSDRAREALDQIAHRTLEFEKLCAEIPHPCMSSLGRLIETMMLPQKDIFATPPHLPPTTLASFYLYGPFGVVLKAGTRLITGLHRLLIAGPDCFSKEDETAMLDVLRDPLRHTLSVAPSDISANGFSCFRGSDLPCPTPSPVSDDRSSYTFSDKATNPAGLLLLLGSLCDALSLCHLFICMVRSILRPRSYFHLQASRRQRRKATKANANEVVHDSVVTTLTERLDLFGGQLLSAVSEFRNTVSLVVDVSHSWMCWSKDVALLELVRLASDTCSEVLPRDFVRQFPVVVPSVTTPLFAEIADSYMKSFDSIASQLKSKIVSLTRIQTELSVYDEIVQKMCKTLSLSFH